MCFQSRTCSSVVALLRRRASEDGDLPAYTFLADGEAARATVTFGELDGRARAVAGTLQSLGLAGERAVLLYPPGLDYITAFFGCLYAGVVAVPAYPPRRNRSQERLQAIVADCRAAAVLTTPAASAAVGELAQALSPHVPHWLFCDQVAADAAQLWREPQVSEDHLAFLQYTSGSTATPRGVMVTHGNLLHNCEWVRRRFELTPESRGVIWLPPYHDMGLIGGIIEPLYAGLHCYLMAPVSVFSSPFTWLQAISLHRATVSGGPNFAYDLCARRVTAEQRATLDLGSWDLAFSGAEPIRAETIDRFTEAFAPCGFRREAFYPCYGLAEATVMASGGKKNSPIRTLSLRKSELEANRVTPSAPEDAGSVTVVSCGHTLGDQCTDVVDLTTQTRCPPGEVGEIWVAGPSVAKGYWEKPEQTQQTFGARLADTGEGPYLRTGDLGFLRDGELFVTGRLKDLIILNGRNLYPQDLELTAERSHPDLQPGCGAAFSVEEGGRERLVVAHEVVPRHRPDVAKVAEAVRAALANEHEAELYAFALVKPGAVPRTSSGKIQRYLCREAFLAATLDEYGRWLAPDQAPGDASDPAASPALSVPDRQGALECFVRDEIARLLRLEPAAVDVHQPVSTFGLDSLTTVELKNSLERGLGITLPLSSFLQGASIAELVSQLSHEQSAAAAGRDSRTVTALLHEVQRLSDDEVRRLLEAEPVPAGGTIP